MFVDALAEKSMRYSETTPNQEMLAHLKTLSFSLLRGNLCFHKHVYVYSFIHGIPLFVKGLKITCSQFIIDFLFLLSIPITPNSKYLLNALEDNGGVLFAASLSFDKQVGEIFLPSQPSVPRNCVVFHIDFFLLIFL